MISFPVRELFQEKLNQFHLIIFDRYRRRGVIRAHYLQNIADYIRRGGALMVAAGPAYAGPLSLAHTAIGPLLPGRATGEVYRQGFRAKRTGQGKRHPVTARLSGAGVGPKPWGRWFRQIEAARMRGHVLLSGLEGKPLLILDLGRQGPCRPAPVRPGLAVGPRFRRRRATGGNAAPGFALADERTGSGGGIPAGPHPQPSAGILRQSLKPINRAALMTAPDGQIAAVPLKDRGDGTAIGSLPVKLPGPVPDRRRQADRDGGDRLAESERDGRCAHHGCQSQAGHRSQRRQRSLAGESGVPDIRRVEPERRVSGAGGVTGRWIGLRRNGDYVVTGIRDIPLLAGFLALLLALLPMLIGWRREGE